MKVKLPSAGKYIVAVSGGVDSMSLLHWLVNQKKSGLELIVAHFNHGIRPDANLDEELVGKISHNFGLTYLSEKVNLGAQASESLARQKRYQFLDKVLKEQKAFAVITAHNQDDVIETAIINIIRGCGRKGLTSLSNNSTRLRPMLTVPKSQILVYAQKNHINWREDTTNNDIRYLRNYIRLNIVPKMGLSGRRQFLSYLKKLQLLNERIDKLLVILLIEMTNEGTMSREKFINLPFHLSKEILACWLRQNGLNNFNSQTLLRLTVAAKVAKINSSVPLARGFSAYIGKDNLALNVVER